MTFTTSIKEEIAKTDINVIEARYELIAFLNSVAKFNKDEINITLENASITRRIYKEIKEIYDVNPNIIIRIQKRFKVKQIYILNIKDKVEFIKKDIRLGTKINVEDLVSDEEKIAFLQGAFLASGGTSMNRTSCLNTELDIWANASDCYNNDWLNNGAYQWTLSPRASSSGAYYVFIVGKSGRVYYDGAFIWSAVRPSVYLISKTSILGGEGTLENPYEVG